MHLTQAMHTSQKSFDSLHVHSNGGSGVQRGAVALKGCSPLTVSPSPALAWLAHMLVPLSTSMRRTLELLHICCPLGPASFDLPFAEGHRLA